MHCYRLTNIYNSKLFDLKNTPNITVNLTIIKYLFSEIVGLFYILILKEVMNIENVEITITLKDSYCYLYQHNKFVI